MALMALGNFALGELHRGYVHSTVNVGAVVLRSGFTKRDVLVTPATLQGLTRASSWIKNFLCCITWWRFVQ